MLINKSIDWLMHWLSIDCLSIAIDNRFYRVVTSGLISNHLPIDVNRTSSIIVNQIFTFSPVSIGIRLNLAIKIQSFD